MTDPGATRVAVYIDFDNIVISRYDEIHGRGQWQQNRARENADAEVAAKLARATVDIGAVIDYASSFGTLALTRAYADWSVPVNADYRRQLVNRAVELVQLFPAAAYAKNGADIRLAVDAVEDMFRLPDITHVVIVGGDSDYVPLAQRCKRLNRYVVGMGVSGSSARSLAAACDEFVLYDRLPGITVAESRTSTAVPLPEFSTGPAAVEQVPVKTARRATAKATTKAVAPAFEAASEPVAEAAAQTETQTPAKATARRTAKKSTANQAAKELKELKDPDDPREQATRLLERALRLGHEKNDEDWLHSSSVKTQMKRMDPSFSEKGLGYRSFTEFVKQSGVAELDEAGQVRRVRLSPQLSSQD